MGNTDQPTACKVMQLTVELYHQRVESTLQYTYSIIKSPQELWEVCDYLRMLCGDLKVCVWCFCNTSQIISDSFYVAMTTCAMTD